ncbi:MAG: hypothetical protein AAF628_16040 [Planctomycetota bacterium]
MTHTFLARASALALPFLLAAPAIGQTTFNRTSPAGGNLSELAYWTTERVFVNVFNRAAPWWSQKTTSSVWQTSEPLDVDADGWVRSLRSEQAAGTLMFRDSAGHYPDGRYHVTYDGDGDLQLGFDAREVRRSPGLIEIDVSPSDAGIYVKLVRTNPADHLRNIRIVHQRHLSMTSEFLPILKQSVAGYRELRFMDFQRTNNSPIREWSERTKPSSYTQDAPGGVALEHMIDLCNETNSDPWVCIPHMASDDYIRNFARVVRDRMRPGLQVWVEYSNEVWNSLFTQHAWAQQEGLRLGLSTSPWTAHMRYYAQRSVDIFDIFEQEFGGTNRIVRVLASQNANPWVGEQIMDWQNAHQSADVLAVAPYFGGGLGDPATQFQIQSWTTEQVLTYCFRDVDASMDTARQNGDNASSRGLRLVAYEGGQHLVGWGGAENNTQLEALFHSANRHPWMYVINLSYLGKWLRSGGTDFVYYNTTSAFSKWGSWGSREYSDDDPWRSPKFLSMLHWVIWNKRTW